MCVNKMGCLTAQEYCEKLSLCFKNEKSELGQEINADQTTYTLELA